MTDVYDGQEHEDTRWGTTVMDDEDLYALKVKMGVLQLERDYARQTARELQGVIREQSGAPWPMDPDPLDGWVP